MVTLCELSLCNGCTACASICPHSCITMQPDAEGFLRPVIDAKHCVSCGMCETVCPVMHPLELPQATPACYAAINLHDHDRAQASSGGVFIQLARWVLGKKGVVFGAAFNDDFSVSHRYVETEEEVYAFCGSKYVQSRIGEAYRQVEAFLCQGRYVLFSGTPCQILGLYRYLGKSYETLINVDIICHGVPSPAVWQKYVEHRASVDCSGELPKAIQFRSKVNSWTKYSVSFQYAHKEYCVPFYEDTYMHGFLENLYLRMSCHNCIAKGINRVSDITLADYWGVQNLTPSMFDDQGTSLVFLHSEKAMNIWQDISLNLKYEKADLEPAVKCNSAALVPVQCHPQRRAFFEQYRQENFDELVWRLAPKSIPVKLSLYRRIRGKLGRIVRKVLRKV